MNKSTNIAFCLADLTLVLIGTISWRVAVIAAIFYGAFSVLVFLTDCLRFGK